MSGPASLSASTDEELVERARRGESQAREELFRRSRDIAYRVAYRHLGHADDAMDAVQNAFIKVFRHLDEFDGRSQFRTWLLRIVTNAALDIGRKRSRRSALRLAEPDSEGAEAAVEEDPAHGLHRQDLRRLLDEALARLNPDIRSTFVLFAEAGLSYKEIAESLGVPIGTVMSRLHFARQKLQAFLQQRDVSAGE
jgi:RNA polymerase sigma-70 factor (ECF subfamily)